MAEQAARLGFIKSEIIKEEREKEKKERIGGRTRDGEIGRSA